MRGEIPHVHTQAILSWMNGTIKIILSTPTEYDSRATNISKQQWKKAEMKWQSMTVYCLLFTLFFPLPFFFVFGGIAFHSIAHMLCFRSQFPMFVLLMRCYSRME